MFNRQKFIDSVTAEAKKHLVWNGPQSEAYKYTKDFIPVFGKGRFSWCAAFQRFNLIASGCKMGLKPSKPAAGYEAYTWAYVEAWQQWAIYHGFYIHNDGHHMGKPGDLEIFDWSGKPEPDGHIDDHIGCKIGESNGLQISAEGNTGNATNIRARQLYFIHGWISLPEGFDQF